MRVVLKTLDAGFFLVEKPEAPAHFGPLLILSRPTEAGPNFVSELVKSWRSSTAFAEPFNYLLRMRPRPAWEVLADKEIDLDYHLRHSALPAPGGELELGMLISRLHSHPLDRSRPLWECHVIEGLENNRFAIYLKLHHGQMDGMGAVQLMSRVFSPDPEKRNTLPPWSIGLEKARRDRSVLSRNFEKMVSAGKTARSIPDAATNLMKLYLGALTGRRDAATAPFEAPRTILNGRIGQPRRYATQHFSLARFKAIAVAAEVTVNDVFLAVCSAALRTYLAKQGDLPKKSIIAQVPVSIRAKGDASVGNSVAFIFVELGTQIADPVERLKLIHTSSEAGKAIHYNLPKSSIEPYTMLLQGPYISQVIMNLGGHIPPAANLVISNVPGPKERIYCDGARIEQIYGPSVLFHGQALNITISSYADEVNLGFTACRQSVPNMQNIALSTSAALAELEQALLPKPKPKWTSKKKAGPHKPARKTMPAKRGKPD
jgi:diacylglycerol O-acyltransferase / wax synthase